VSISYPILYGTTMSSDGTVAGNEFPTYSTGTKFDSNSLLEICPGGADYQLRCRIKDLNLIQYA